VNFDFDQLRELLSVLGKTDISELSLKSEGFELTIKKENQAGARGAAANGVASELTAAASVVPSAPSPTLPSVETTNIAPPPPASSASDRLLEITSPMVGTFYRSPAPDEAPFVEVGDRIRPSQTVCIIEAMKLMNELESEISGEIVEILAQNGEPVEYGQVLIRVKPV
jgi:acetyl-CoA carboxylase biotin carboxyl carrier protein